MSSKDDYIFRYWDRGWKLLRGNSAMARFLDHGPEFWPRIYQYMPWDGTQYPRSEFGMVYDIPVPGTGKR